MAQRIAHALTALLAMLATAHPAAAQSKAPDVPVTIAASQEAIAPGMPFDVAFRFELPEGYHLYWENPGDSGKPPMVAWQLPDGFEAGPLQFPAPKRHVQAGIVTFVLEGAPIFTATITPPSDLAVGEPVEVKADLSWLICKKACFPGKKQLSLTLKTAAEAVPTSDEDIAFLFRLAERSQPVATDKASDITLSAKASTESISNGDSFEIVLDVKVKLGFHIQSNKPLGEFFVAANVYPRRVPGIAYLPPIWPTPHFREDRNFGKVSEFTGEVQVNLPVKVTGPTATENPALSGLLTYQACNDRGQCHPPESVEWSVQVASTSVDANATVDHAGATPTDMADGNSADGGTGIVDGASAGGASKIGLIGAILGGLLGGLILNIMPCVLPVISIKILSFVNQANEDPKRVFQLGLTFAAGIIVSFLIIAVAILWLQSATKSAQSWGTLFQQPGFVAAMVIVMFVFAMNLFGVFEIVLPGAAAGKLAGATEREGFGGAFMKGVLATLLATPCTAPYLASAISFALASSKLVTFLIFASAGVGMAFPYVLLTAKPAWMKYMPKPGTWMVNFKQFMGFLLIGTAVWLLWVLGALRGEAAVVWMVAFLAFLGLACWIVGRIGFGWKAGRKLAGWGAAIAVLVFGAWFSYGNYVGVPPVAWTPFEPGLAKQLAAGGQTVYVDYTAKWCITCQANKKLVFGNDDVLKKFDAYSVVPVKADYTNHDPAIADDLRRFNRDAVPLNVIYPAGKPDEPILLPVVLTPGTVLEALEKAGPSKVKAERSETEQIAGAKL